VLHPCSSIGAPEDVLHAVVFVARDVHAIIIELPALAVNHGRAPETPGTTALRLTQPRVVFAGRSDDGFFAVFQDGALMIQDPQGGVVLDTRLISDGQRLIPAVAIGDNRVLIGTTSDGITLENALLFDPTKPRAPELLSLPPGTTGLAKIDGDRIAVLEEQGIAVLHLDSLQVAATGASLPDGAANLTR